MDTRDNGYSNFVNEKTLAQLFSIMGSQIPPLLRSYIHGLNPGSLTLITSVLGATGNWLVVCYLAAALGKLKSNLAQNRKNDNESDLLNALEDVDDTAVVLVSWMRDWNFWRTEARRSLGLDLNRLKHDGYLAFIDGLTTSSTDSPFSSQSSLPSLNNQNPLKNALPIRNRPAIRPSGSVPQVAASADTLGHGTTQFQSPIDTISRVYKSISDALEILSKSPNAGLNRRILLILDSPSMLLETYPQIPETTTVASAANEMPKPKLRIDSLQELITHLRSQHCTSMSTVVAVSADDALLASAQNLVSAQHRIYRGGGTTEFYKGAKETPLEIQTAAFIVGLAHQARFVLQCRRLDTGWAEDVSGVIRVSRGGAIYDDMKDEDDTENNSDQRDTGFTSQTWQTANGTFDDREADEGEWLYHIGKDGNAKVWSRGSGTD